MSTIRTSIERQNDTSVTTERPKTEQLTAAGGKGKGLVWLEENKRLGYIVPKFRIIDTSYYDDIEKQSVLIQLLSLLRKEAGISNCPSTEYRFANRRLQDKCDEVLGVFRGKNVYVRSSAILSEDNEKNSGAGIYETIFLSSDRLSSQTLFDAVIKVYNSVYSEKAKRYREERGIPGEKMEVIIQEEVKGWSGVAMSRLPARGGIISISWSKTAGAVVHGSSDGDKISTIYLSTREGTDDSRARTRIVFKSEGTSDNHVIPLQDHFVPLIRKIRKEYGNEVELEFVARLPTEGSSLRKVLRYRPIINLLQIRPLTNVQNKIIGFPNKQPILDGKYCMGAGEYIGPYVTPQQVVEGWNEPAHYAYVASTLEKSLARLDYDKLTPRKRAIVLTNGVSNPGTHALTIANEKGILCIVGEGKYEEKPEEKGTSVSEESLKRGAILLAACLGDAIARPVKFDVPREEVGNHIHIVSDGLRSFVYSATKEEAEEFAHKNGLSKPE